MLRYRPTKVPPDHWVACHAGCLLRLFCLPPEEQFDLAGTGKAPGHVVQLLTLRVPPGHQVTLNRSPPGANAIARPCSCWVIWRSGDLDRQALFEQFRGVIGAQVSGPLPLADCLGLDTRQSLLNTAQCELAHVSFQRYRAWHRTAHTLSAKPVANSLRR